MGPTDAPLIPLETLLGNPEKTQPQLSPDGARMAFIAPIGGVLNVCVGTVGADDAAPVTKDTDRGIRQYMWAFDNRHLLYIQDVGGDENWHLYAVDLHDGRARDLTPFPKVQVNLLARSKDFPNTMLIALNKDDERLHDAYRLDIPSGELTLVAKNTGNIVGWEADRQMRVRAVQAARADGGFDLMVRDDDDAEWRTIIEWSPDDGLGVGPLGFTKDGRHLFVLDSRDANATRLVKIDLATGASDVIAEDPQSDVQLVLNDNETYEPLAVGFMRDRLEWTVLDASIKDDFAAIAGLTRGDFAVVSRDSADRTWLVAFTTDDGPISYYAFERATKQATFLFHARSGLNNYTLAQTEPFVFTARDGLVIHGYLTFPAGVERRTLPTVLNVHGGPWGRDMWGFNPEAQWLANRGYLCVQVNFRGSTGYGKELMNAGDREWGGKMHDDLIDAVEWTVENGYADRERIAIYGGSYGGYAALVGATFTPDVFRCAVDIVGPSSLKTLIESVPPYWSTMLATFHRRVGHPEQDEAFLRERSPLFRVDQIKIPLLIAQGANDPRVKQAESEQIVAAMKEKGIDHEYMLFPDEGHGFAKPENRIRFYEAAEQFLAKHLGGRAAG